MNCVSHHAYVTTLWRQFIFQIVGVFLFVLTESKIFSKKLLAVTKLGCYVYCDRKVAFHCRSEDTDREGCQGQQVTVLIPMLMLHF